jgi:hypothetical protein
MTTPFMPPNSVLSYINNNGQATQVISIGDGSGDVTRIGPDGKVITPAPGQMYLLAPDYVQIVLYPDGNIKQYESNHADGSGINLQFADTNLLSLFGPDNGFSHGPLTESTVTTASGLVIDQKFSNGHLTDYSLTYNDLHIVGHYDASSNTSTLSLQNNAYTTPLANSGVGNIDILTKQSIFDPAAVISNDGGSLIGHDGASLIGHDGASLIGHDGASLDQLSIAALIGHDGASLIGHDGASLITSDGAGILSGNHVLNDAGAFDLNDGSDLIGSDGASFAANFMAHAALGVSHYSLASFTPPAPTPFHWVGGSGDWSDPSHWSQNNTTGTVPGTNDQAIIDASGTYTVTLDTSQNIYSLTVNAAKATVADGTSGVLNVGAGLTLSAGTFQLQSGGTIVGGTLSTTGGHFVWNGGTLDASTYLGNLDLSAANAKLHIAEGLTTYGSGGVGAGTILLTGANSQLFFDGSQAFDNAVIQFGSTAKGTHVERLSSNDPSHAGNVVLTLVPGVTINQTGASVEMDSGNASGDGFDVQGTINATRAAGLFTLNANSFTNEGSINVANGDAFSLNGVSITNKSKIAVTTGGQATISDNNFTNTASGTITVDGAKSSLTFSGGWTNAGTIAITNGGSVHAAGSATTADLGTIVNPDNPVSGGTFFIDGTLDNTGATLDLSGGHYGKVVLTGTITSGTITDPSSDLSFSGNLATLDGVTVTSPLQLSVPGSKVTITHGITANNGGSGDGEIDVKAPFSTLEFDGTQTIDHLVINLGSTASGTHTENLNVQDFSFSHQTVTFGSNTTINQTGVSVLLSTQTGADAALNGTLNANFANGFFGIEMTDTFTLNGTINVGNGDFLAVDDLVPPGSTFTNNGTIVIDGGRMRIASQTLNGTGTITIDADGVLFLGHNAAGQTVAFGPTGGELALEQPALVTVGSGNPVNITGIAAGDQLDLEGIGLAKSATYDGSVLTVTKQDNTVLQFNVQGLAPNNPFIITKDAFGNGSLITAASQDVTWKTAVDGDFADAAKWLQNRVPGAGDNAMITAVPAPSHSYTVSSTADQTVFTLGTVKGATLDIGNTTTFTVLNGTGTGTRANLGTIKVEDGSTLAVGGPINNGGTIDLHSTGTTTTLELLGNVALSGKGSITLDDAHSRIIGNGSPVNLTNTNSISGTGTIGDATLALINKGTIAATGTSPLIINAGRGVANGGSLLAQGTGGLQLTNTIVTNSSSGKLSALSGSHIDLNGASIVAGTLSGPINVLGAGNLLDGSTPQGKTVAAVTNVNVATITDGASLTLAGTVKNKGTFALNSTGDHTELAIKGSVTLSGPGKVTLSDDDHNVIDSNGASASLLNTQAISGAGTIGDHFLQMINKGTITATDNNGNDLVITGDVPFSNFNLLDANGGDLVIKNAFIDQTSSSKATIEGDAPSSIFAGTVELDNASIKGGSLKGTFATTALETSTLIGTAVTPLTITGTKTGLNGTLEVVNNSNLELVGTIKNLGAITLDQTGASLVISGEVTLQGPSGGPTSSKGVITLLPGSSLVNDNRDAVLDNEGNSIRCAGVIGNSSPTARLTINNISGDITATNVMMLEPAALNNSAVIAAVGGAQLEITNTTITNAFQQPGKSIGKGTVETTGSGALILLTAANIQGLSVTTGTGAKAKTTITGGKVITVAGSTIEATGSATSTISNQAVTNNGTLLASDGNLVINGLVANNGILEASSNTPLNGLVQTNGRLSVSGAVTGTGHAVIDGTGEFEINGTFSQNVTFDASATGVLRIDQAALFKGSITGFGLTNAPSAVIDLANVNSSTATKSYNTTTGVLTIDDHQGHVANLKFLGGPYTVDNFNITDDGTGHVKLIDPPADNAATANAHLPMPNLGLLGSYIASVFTAGGHGGGFLSAEPPQAWSQPLLAHPHSA